MTPLVFIVGPTATGKSDLALSLAEKYECEILNADSVQAYKYLEIGVAKPTREERQRVKHHLMDVIEPPNVFTAGQYHEMATKVIEDAPVDRPLIVVGGSGFYVQALEKGMFDVEAVPEEIEAEIRDQLEDKGSDFMNQIVKQMDPEFAKTISDKDSYRISRALALMKAQNRTMTDIQDDFQKKQDDRALKNPKVKVGLKMDRDRLRERVRSRVEKMVEDGLVEEVMMMESLGLREWSPLKSVGYKEIWPHLDEGQSLDEVKDEIVKNTMRLAKRQMTWFKRDPQITWFESDQNDQAMAYVEDQLKDLK